MSVQLELLASGRIAVRFPYDPDKVRRLKKLHYRRWVKSQRYWEILASEFPRLVELFAIPESEIPPDLVSANATAGAQNPVEVRLDALEGRLVGLGFPVDAVDRATSFLVPGHKFSPRYKSGAWDGRRHLFSPATQKFPAGLWPRVREVFDRAGVVWKLNTAAAPPAEDIALRRPPTPLRQYQSDAIETALAAERGIFQIATGGGKTLLAASLIHRLSRRTIFFVHTRELLYQTRDVLLRELGEPIGVLGDGEVELAPVIVATIQTAARILEIPLDAEKEEGIDEEGEERPITREELREAAKRAILDASVVIFDECHHVPADTCFRLSRKMKKAHFRFGLSATPWTDPGRDLLLEAALGAPLCKLSGSDLIRAGYLVAPEITMQTVPSVSSTRRRPVYAQVYRAAIVENSMRNFQIASLARGEASQGRSVLILVAQVRHGEFLRSLLPSAEFAYGNLDSESRRDCIDRLRSGALKILIATTLADEGLDIPSLDSLILAGGGKSAVRAYQRVGRALRPSEGKTTARIFDFFDRGPFLEEHSVERLTLYRREPAFKVRTVGFRA